MRPEPRIDAALPEQAAAVTFFDDAARVDHDEAVHRGDGGKPVPIATTDAQLFDPVRFFATRMMLVVEPSRCFGLAAANEPTSQLRGQPVGTARERA